MAEIILKNESFTLTVGEDCIVRSLRLNKTGEECVEPGEETALFSVTQERPFNNEVKLAHPNRRLTCQGTRLRREGNLLRVSFETVPVKAVIAVREAREYIALRLEGFEVEREDYDGLCMDTPPVAELRLCALPAKKRERFGEWLSVVWDERAALCVLAASPHARVDQEKRARCRLLSADAVAGIRLEGCEAAIIACPPEEFLPAVEAFERDYDLPAGVASRRDPLLNASVYWTSDLSPDNVEEHIARARQGGFRLMLVYYKAFFREERGYWLCGDYDYNDRYPNGRADVEKVLARLREAGITPGLHFLHTHIGLGSRYVTPHADHRLGKKRRFTLARALEDGAEELCVEEDPAGSPMHPKCRVLQFGGELISYEAYTRERPFRFTGIRRGALATEMEPHSAGQVGSVLDISEYGATSCYIDQDSSLQDEIAEKIAGIYDAGFRFCYMDGSEGTNAPCGFHVPMAQYRVYRRLAQKPLFTEGAARAHFSWHFQAGGNAFDVFPPAVFKEMIARFPAEEAPRMRQDFTRLDFGWWGFWAPDASSSGTQADQYEYGASRAAAWDCPASIQADLERFRRHPRVGDILEVMRRWEEVRASGWLTDEKKAELRRLDREHTLLKGADGGWELVPCERAAAPEGVSVYLFERGGATWAVYWHERGAGKLRLPIAAKDAVLTDETGRAAFPLAEDGKGALLPVDDKRYLRTSLAREALVRAFAEARLIEAD